MSRRPGAGPAVVIAAGGTGGHVFPALTVARRLREAGARVTWIGTARGLEAELVPAAGFDFHRLPVRGLRGGGVRRWLAAPFALLSAGLRAVALLRRARPAVVLGMGGYASAPVGLAARILGLALVVHEQNAVPGLANRLLAPLASRVLEAFPGAFPARRRAVHTGNPVRPEVLAVAPPETRLAGRRGPLRLLVLGGSQGALALNRAVPPAVALVARDRPVDVRHQAGARHAEVAESAYRAAAVPARVCGFIDDVAEAYAWADLVVCRAGAMTVAELAAAGVASVLVPYPHAVDDHQSANARFLATRGAAVVLPQTELEPPRLAAVVGELAAARDRLLAMARAARRAAVPDAAQRVARACLEAAHA